MGEQHRLFLVHIQQADLVRPGGSGCHQGRLAQGPHSVARLRRRGDRPIRQERQLPQIGRDPVRLRNQPCFHGLRHLRAHIEPARGIAQHRVHHDQRSRAQGRAAVRGAHAADHPGGDLDLLGAGEVAGDDQVDHAEQRIGLDVAQYPAEHVRRRDLATTAPRRRAAEHHRRRQDRIDLVRRQHILLRCPPDPGGRHERREDQSQGHPSPLAQKLHRHQQVLPEMVNAGRCSSTGSGSA